MPQEPDPRTIAFRRLTLDDLPLMHRWLNKEHVRRWWGPGGSTLAELATKYGPRIDGREPVDPFVILCNGVPVGYIQMCLLRDYPEHAACVGAGDAAAGLDVFIGDPGYVHQGLGPRILRAFVEHVVFARDGVDVCTVDPSVSNTSAIRAYEQAGFVHLRTARMPGEVDPAYVMVLKRALDNQTHHTK